MPTSFIMPTRMAGSESNPNLMASRLNIFSSSKNRETEKWMGAQEMKSHSWLQEKCNKIADHFGFQQIEIPYWEFKANYTQRNQSCEKMNRQRKKLNQLWEIRDGAEEKVLRPTVHLHTIATMVEKVCQTGDDFEKMAPLKWFSSGRFFDFKEVDTVLRNQVSTQFVLHTIGTNTSSTSMNCVDIITYLINVLEDIGLSSKTVSVRINSIVLLRAVLKNFNIVNETMIVNIFKVLQKYPPKKDIDMTRTYLLELRLEWSAVENILALSKIKSMEEMHAFISKDSEDMFEQSENLKAIEDILTLAYEYGIDDWLTFDPCYVTEHIHYTHIIFQCCDKAGKLQPLFFGGHTWLTEINVDGTKKDVYCTNGNLNMKDVLTVCRKQRKKTINEAKIPDYLVVAYGRDSMIQPACAIGRRLREGGKNVIVYPHVVRHTKMPQLIAYAESLEVKKIAYASHSEWKSDIVKFTNVGLLSDSHVKRRDIPFTDITVPGKIEDIFIKEPEKTRESQISLQPLQNIIPKASHSVHMGQKMVTSSKSQGTVLKLWGTEEEKKEEVKEELHPVKSFINDLGIAGLLSNNQQKVKDVNELVVPEVSNARRSSFVFYQDIIDQKIPQPPESPQQKKSKNDADRQTSKEPTRPSEKKRTRSNPMRYWAKCQIANKRFKDKTKEEEEEEATVDLKQNDSDDELENDQKKLIHNEVSVKFPEVDESDPAPVAPKTEFADADPNVTDEETCVPVSIEYEAFKKSEKLLLEESEKKWLRCQYFDLRTIKDAYVKFSLSHDLHEDIIKFGRNTIQVSKKSTIDKFDSNRKGSIDLLAEPDSDKGRTATPDDLEEDENSEPDSEFSNEVTRYLSDYGEDTRKLVSNKIDIRKRNVKIDNSTMLSKMEASKLLYSQGEDGKVVNDEEAEEKVLQELLYVPSSSIKECAQVLGIRPLDSETRLVMSDHLLCVPLEIHYNLFLELLLELRIILRVYLLGQINKLFLEHVKDFYDLIDLESVLEILECMGLGAEAQEDADKIKAIIDVVDEGNTQAFELDQVVGIILQVREQFYRDLMKKEQTLLKNNPIPTDALKKQFEHDFLRMDEVLSYYCGNKSKPYTLDRSYLEFVLIDFGVDVKSFPYNLQDTLKLLGFDDGECSGTAPLPYEYWEVLNFVKELRKYFNFLIGDFLIQFYIELNRNVGWISFKKMQSALADLNLQPHTVAEQTIINSTWTQEEFTELNRVTLQNFCNLFFKIHERLRCLRIKVRKQKIEYLGINSQKEIPIRKAYDKIIEERMFEKADEGDSVNIQLSDSNQINLENCTTLISRLGRLKEFEPFLFRFQQIDKDEDGLIDYEQFIDFYCLMEIEAKKKAEKNAAVASFLNKAKKNQDDKTRANVENQFLNTLDNIRRREQGKM